MNRNEVIEAMAKAAYEGRPLSKKADQKWDDLDPIIQSTWLPDHADGLTALEAIMERDGLKLTSANADDEMHKAGMEKRHIQDQMNKTANIVIDTSDIWKAMHDQAKCKLRGGE